MITFIPLSVPFVSSQDASASATIVQYSLNKDASLPETEHARALAYLLQMDDIRVLIDCGAPEDFMFPTFKDMPAGDNKDDDDDALHQNAESSSMARQRAEHNHRSFDLSQLTCAPLDATLEKLAPTIDLVLLSHSSLSHLGLYAYAYARFGLRCLVYATMPVQSMGKLTVLEAIETWRNEVDIEKESISKKPNHNDNDNTNSSSSSDGNNAIEHRCLPTVDEVNEAFEEIKVVRYLQPTHLDGKCAGLTLTAYSAGHSLGGAVWKIRSPTSGTVLVALDWNHNRERHLDGTALLASSGAAAPSISGASASSGGISDAVRRPDLLITEIQRGLVVNTRRKDRDAALLDLVHKTIQGGHSVLLPVDPSARLLELLVLLDQHWAYAYPHARFPLCLISRTGKEVLERARTYMEWMTREWATKATDSVAAQDSSSNNTGSKNHNHHNNKKGKNFKTQAPSSPLDFRFLRVFSSIAAMDEAIPDNQAKVVLAVPPSMTHGPSRRLLAKFASNPNDLIILVQRGDPGSLARELWDLWNHKQDAGFSWVKGKLGVPVSPQTEVRFELKSKVPLEGEELRAFLEAEQVERDRQAQQRALLARSRRRLEADEDDDSSDSEDESEDEGDTGTDGMLRLPSGKVSGGGFAEPGSLGARKRSHGVAFDDPSDPRGGANGMGGVAGGGPDNGTGGDVSTQVSFDIYLKGNASRATSFFGSKPSNEGPFGVGVRFRLFPAIERKRRVDGYGETVDVGRWLSRRRQIEAEAAAASGNKDDTDDDAHKRRKTHANGTANGNKTVSSVPSKFITEQVQVNVDCRVTFIEMEGLNDGRALKTLIPQMHPRRLILVNGDPATRQDMLSSLSSIKSMTKEIYLPAFMVNIQIGEITNSYTVNLGEGLLAALSMSRFEDFEVGHVKASVRFASESTIPILEAVGSDDVSLQQDQQQQKQKQLGQDQDGVQGLVIVPTSNVVSSTTTADESVPPTSVATISKLSRSSHTGASMGPTLFVGDLKLSTLKSALSGPTYRMSSDFAGEGMLVCGAQTGRDAVTIQKIGQGKIVIEGNVGRSFKNVRKAVYDLHARVVGQ